jgi:crossover junction endodeoxyribonuclease RuvC
MRRVCGLDLSLTSTGIGLITQSARGTRMVTDTITSKGKRAASLADRYERISTLGRDIVHHAATAELVVIEGPVTGVKGGSPIDRYSLFWYVAGPLIRRGIPIAIVSPTSLKLAIAGKGNADKVQVALAVAKLWPDADLGNNDSADAAGLAHLGAVRLGWDVPTLERHHAVKAEWPVLMSDDSEEAA